MTRAGVHTQEDPAAGADDGAATGGVTSSGGRRRGPDAPIRNAALRARARLHSLVPGLALVAVATAVSMGIGRFVPAVSPLLIAIILGAVLANTVTLPQRIAPGLTFSSKRLLRIGIALLGLQLVVGDVLALGWGAIAVIAAVVVLGVSGGMWVGGLLGLSWTQRLLISCGFSICGAAAVAAVDGVIEPEEEETVTSIALVTLFGTAMILVIPVLAGVIGLTDEQAGMWTGASVHEVAQVVAIGGIIGGGALAVAVVVKLGRVLLLAPVLTTVSLLRRRRMAAPEVAGIGAVEGGAPEDESAEGGAAEGGAAAKRPPIVPLFVAGFLAFVALGSTGIVPSGVLSVVEVCQTALLTAAMFALGTGVRAATMRKVGPRPFVLALAVTVWVTAIGLAGVLLIG